MVDPDPKAAGTAPAERARTLAYLYLAGAGIGLGTLVLFPQPPDTDIAGVYLVAGLAFAVGLMLWFGGRRLPVWGIPVGIAAGIAIISLDIYFAGDIRTNDEMYYLWVAFYSFYFLPQRIAWLELALVGVGYAIAVGLRAEPDGTTRWVVTMGTLAFAGILTARLVSQLARWVQHSHQREAALRNAEERFRSAFDDAAIGMALTSLDGRWLRVNDALARLTGYSPEELVGKGFRDLTPEEHLASDLNALRELASGRLNAYHAEKPYRRADGSLVWVALGASLVRDDEGRPLHLISQMQDITARKAAEHELAERALHDPLTGLPNRLLFLDRVQMALARIEQTRTPVAVFFIDLDRFKLVNDSLGHAIGDGMLIEVGERLTSALRPNDTVSRFGGDEFTILCENIDEDGARRVAARIRASLAEPFSIADRELFASASLGVSITRDHRAVADAMLRDADAAMYRAKERGRSNFEIFDGAMRSQATERLELENDLRRAIDRDELRLLYQPLVWLRTGRAYGVEALLRWEHPSRGLLEPTQFIGMAEESGLIVPIGEWVIAEACRQASKWHKSGRELAVSINISPRQLNDHALVDVVRRTIEQTGLNPDQICLEITESAAVDAAGDRLVALKALGVRFALDDFGTGFSSLNQIRSLPPVDALKIDRSFVEELGHRSADRAIAGAIIGIAGALGLETVAEGIERAGQVEELRSLGCERGQGFFFAEPAPAEAIEALLRERTVRRAA